MKKKIITGMFLIFSMLEAGYNAQFQKELKAKKFITDISDDISIVRKGHTIIATSKHDFLEDLEGKIISNSTLNTVFGKNSYKNYDLTEGGSVGYRGISESAGIEFSIVVNKKFIIIYPVIFQEENEEIFKEYTNTILGKI